MLEQPAQDPKPEWSEQRWRWTAWISALAVALPSLGLGFFMDDWFALARLRMEQSWFPDLFRFIHEGRADQQGPWWTHPQLEMAFWRPLSALTARIDDTLFGLHAWGWHLHSVLWFVALLGLAHLAYERLLPGKVGAWAFFAYAIDDVHFLPVAWLSNRNALICAVFSLWSITAYTRDHRPRTGLRALFPFVLALLSGEAGIEAIGYFAAFELVSQQPWRERALRFAPMLAIGIGYLGLRQSLGYGVRNSASYFDPLTDPGTWLTQAPGRFFANFGAFLWTTPLNLWLFHPEARLPLIGAGVVAVGATLAILQRAWPTIPTEQRRTLTWLGVGSVLALVPALSAFPATRLGTLPAFGSSALLVVAIDQWRKTKRTEADPGFFLRTSGGILSMNVWSAPLSWIFHYGVVGWLGTSALTTSLHADLGGSGVREVFLVNAPEPSVGLFLPAMRWVTTGTPPPRYTILSLSPTLRWSRTGPDRFVIEAPEGKALLQSEFERIFGGEQLELKTGYLMRRGSLSVHILEADERGPTRVEIKLDRSLDDPSQRFVAWNGNALVSVTVGQRVPGLLEPATFPEAP